MSDSFVTPWTVAHQAPLSMAFPGKKMRVGCGLLLQGIFLTQGWNLGLLHRQADSLPLNHQGSPLRGSSLLILFFQLDFRFRTGTTWSTLSTNTSAHTQIVEGMLVEYFCMLLLPGSVSMTRQFGIDS